MVCDVEDDRIVTRAGEVMGDLISAGIDRLLWVGEVDRPVIVRDGAVVVVACRDIEQVALCSWLSATSL